VVSFLILSPFRARSRLDTYHTQVLAADITPTLERLREEKSHYLRWSANAAEVSRLERFCVAAEYDEAEKAAAVSGEGMYRRPYVRVDGVPFIVRRVDGVAAAPSYERRVDGVVLGDAATPWRRHVDDTTNTQAPRKPNKKPKRSSRRPPIRPTKLNRRKPRRPNAGPRTAPPASLRRDARNLRRPSTTRRRRSLG